MTDLGLGIGAFVALFVALLLCIGAGRRSGRKAFGGGRAHPAGLGAVEAVTFGLLGLLLAFTFSGAAARLDTRRVQIVDEANALGTAWLRLDVLPPSAQPALRETFRQYTDSIASRAHMIVLAFVLSFTFYVILDFEYPRLGFIRIDDFDNLLVQVRASMN